MEHPIFKPVGTPMEQLDTPSLVVDIGVLERNIETMHSFFRDSDVKLRPRVDVHLCPAIAHKQLAAGGTVGGITVTTLGQAEVFSQSGFTDILVANLVVTPQKIARLCSLARHAKMTVAVDNVRNVGDLSDAATEAGVALNVVALISTGPDQFGVEPGAPAVDLARSAADAPGLCFAGLMTAGDAILEADPERLESESRRRVQPVLDTREMAERAGLAVGVVSTGGSYNYELVAVMDGVTEVPAGTYALMDESYRAYRSQFSPAARVISSVTSLPEDGLAIVDGGHKAIGSDTGFPSVDVPGAVVKGLSAEHGSLILDVAANGLLSLEDRVWFTPYDMGDCVNLHDYMHVVRDGSLEAIWDIPARGRYR